MMCRAISQRIWFSKSHLCFRKASDLAPRKFRPFLKHPKESHPRFQNVIYREILQQKLFDPPSSGKNLNQTSLDRSLSDLSTRKVLPTTARQILQSIHHALPSTSLSLQQALSLLFADAVYRYLDRNGADHLMKAICSYRNQLTLNQLEILAYSSYILQLPFCNFPELLNDAAQLLEKGQPDLSQLITVWKFLQQNGFKSPSLYETAAKLIKQKFLNEIQGHQACQILALLTSVKYFDEELMMILESVIISDMHEDYPSYSSSSPDELLKLHPSEKLRAKDVSRYLHSFAMFNLLPSDSDLIVKDLKQRLETSEFHRYPHHLVQCIHALSILDVYDSDLIRICLSKWISDLIGRGGWKDAGRWLYCLYENCRVERPELLENIEVGLDELLRNLPEDFCNRGFELASRDMVVIEAVKEALERKYGKSAVDLRRILPHFETSVLEVKSGSADALLNKLHGKSTPVTGREWSVAVSCRFVVEVLDEWTCISERDGRLSGMTAARIRVMKKLGWSVKMVRASAIRKFLEGSGETMDLLDLMTD